MSSFQIYQNLTTVRREPPTNLNLVDVRDVALGHALALEHPEAGGERFILSNGPFLWAQLRKSPVHHGFHPILMYTLLIVSNVGRDIIDCF